MPPAASTYPSVARPVTAPGVLPVKSSWSSKLRTLPTPTLKGTPVLRPVLRAILVIASVLGAMALPGPSAGAATDRGPVVVSPQEGQTPHGPFVGPITFDFSNTYAEKHKA